MDMLHRTQCCKQGIQEYAWYFELLIVEFTLVALFPRKAYIHLPYCGL